MRYHSKRIKYKTIKAAFLEGRVLVCRTSAIILCFQASGGKRELGAKRESRATGLTLKKVNRKSDRIEAEVFLAEKGNSSGKDRHEKARK